MKILLPVLFVLVFSLIGFGQTEDEPPPILNGITKTKKQLDEERKQREKLSKEAKKKAKELEKENKKKAKEQEKLDKQLEKNRIAGMTVDLAYLAKFPQNYVGRKWMGRGSFGELKLYTDGKDRVYLVEVAGRDVSFSNYFLSNQVTFVVSESMAKEMFDFYTNYKTQYSLYGAFPGRAYFELIQANLNGNIYFLAKTECVEFTGLFGAKVGSVGNCQ